jgi:hypothetical protein
VGITMGGAFLEVCFWVLLSRERVCVCRQKGKKSKIKEAATLLVDDRLDSTETGRSVNLGNGGVLSYLPRR